jgi:hypothetical protein
MAGIIIAPDDGAAKSWLISGKFALKVCACCRLIGGAILARYERTWIRLPTRGGE